MCIEEESEEQLQQEMWKEYLSEKRTYRSPKSDDAEDLDGNEKLMAIDIVSSWMDNQK